MKGSIKPVNKVLNGAEQLVLKISGLIIFALFWEIVTRAKLVDTQFLPSFTQTLAGMGRIIASGLLFTSIMVSLWRAFVGLIIAAIIAIPLGLVLGRRKRDVEDCFNPFFRMLSQVNPFSLMPIFILFFGIGETVKLAVVAWVSLWPILFNTLEGTRNVDPIVIKTARAMASTKTAMLFKIILPGAASSIYTGLRLGIEMSFFMLIAAEMIGASYGLGWLLHFSSMNAQFVLMYAAILSTIILGFGMSTFLKFLHSRFFFWRENFTIVNAGSRERRSFFTKAEMWFSGILVILILAIGSWQIGVAKQQALARGTSLHEHLSMTGYSSE
jgi:NitT/TauT family transport system permease protein